MKTDVCITFDIEFTIGGAFADPDRNRPVGAQSVLCEVDGKSEGLGFILETLAAHRLTATFFLETLNTYYFGDEEMARFAQQISRAGHDVQLHLHPCWRHFRHANWQAMLDTRPPNDSMANRESSELRRLISDGLDVFSRWGLPRPLALRSGGLHVDQKVYSVMQELGMPMSSNIGLAIFQPNEPELQLYSGAHSISGVLEVPVLSYCDFSFRGRRHLKTLTITGSSWEETRALLLHAVDKKINPVVLLSHPSEYVKHQDVQYTKLRANRINQKRFRKLCQFLDKNRDSFNTRTFAEGYQVWSKQTGEKQHVLVSPLWATTKRLLENRLNDSVWWW